MADNLEGVIPPHDLSVEAALLGSMLLTRDAIAAAMHLVSPDDFYLPAHKIIAAAIGDLVATNEPVDAVIVADQLRQRRQLDQIGGPAVLVRLTASVIASYHAAKYGEIVARLARERRQLVLASVLLDAAVESDTDTVRRLAAEILQLHEPAVEATVTPLRRSS